jgi:hypothetical protein
MKPVRIIVFALISALMMSPFAVYGQTSAKKSNAAPTPARGHVEGITAAQMKDYLTFIASDELEGRDTPSRGLDIAALYIASHLSRWGLKPAGDNGTYFQPIRLRKTKIDPATTQVQVNNQSFVYGQDFLASPVAGRATAPLVYVSHGWMVKSKNINAYKDVDIKDKFIITSLAPPKDVTPDSFSGKQGEDWANAYIYAQRHGAKGIILIAGFQTLSNWEHSRRSALEKGTVSLEEAATELPAALSVYAPPKTMPTVYAPPKMLAALFQGEKQNGATIFNRAMSGDPVEPFELNPNKRITVEVGVNTEPAVTKNVVAVLEGSDPALKNEYVAVGAHYDHVGAGLPGPGEGRAPGKDPADLIYNGADDDGSGTVSIMAMAEAFAKGPRPKRSILFVWHAGEEKGLWGAKHFTEHPTVPIHQIITQLNIDMIGRAKKEGDTNPENKDLARQGEVFVIGSKMMSTELGEISEAVNRSYLNIGFNYKYDDPKDPNQYFFRSDHFHYAQKGVPIIFYFDGEHEDYHRPSDHVDKIDFEQMEKIARTIYATAWELANRAQRPRVDKSLPTELTEH